MNGKEIHKIVITGGPGAGKTTAMERIQSYFTDKGYAVIFVPETATELILGGVAPWTCVSNLEYQMCQMQLQLRKEEIFEQGAASLKADKVLIVCDRGLLDNKAYMNDEEFQAVQDKVGVDEQTMLSEYDAVFHLETAAKGNKESYTLDNNGARTETVEEAVALDEKIIEAWAGHPHLSIIRSNEDFESKLDEIMEEISEFLNKTA